MLPPMKIRAKAGALGAVLVLALAATGCSGVNANGSVSPASFFLPGLMRVQPPKPAPADADAPRPTELASVLSREL